MQGEKIGTRGIFRPAYVFEAANVVIIFSESSFIACKSVLFVSS